MTAFVTIASANYLAAARVLCRSLAEHHPESPRFVVLVDHAGSPFLEKNEPFEVIGVEELGIPDVEDFLAQYTCMEANTAVKPYAMRLLFGRPDIERLVYLDPDIWVHSPLDAVFRALDRGEVVLTPHMRDPFRDEETPTEEDILRAGTYNLGFVAMRRGPAAEKLLTWWSEKTESDCVVDWENGLFVDQKWMDLVPGYVAGTVVLDEPGYNVSYWNLHERRLTVRDGRYSVDGRPLAFFHFSGYSPDRPVTLSKHQTRHHLRSAPALKALCDGYAERLQAEGYERTRRAQYGYSLLANGVPVSPAVRGITRHLRKRGIRYPSARNADEFCRFLMTPNAEVAGAEIAPLAGWILRTRPDVAQAFPAARWEADDPGLLHWLEGSAHECQAEELYRRFGRGLTQVNPFTRVRRIYEARPDVRAAHPDAFRTFEGLRALGGWLFEYGTGEEDISVEDAQSFVSSGLTGFEHVLDLYLCSPALQEKYPLALMPCGNDFLQWLMRDGARSNNLSVAECLWFGRRLLDVHPDTLLLLTALRTEWASLRFPLGATPFGWSELTTWARAQAQSRGYHLTGLGVRPPGRLGPVQSLELLHATGPYSRVYPRAMHSRAGLREFVDAVAPLFGVLHSDERAAIDAAIGNYDPVEGVNVAGHFHYAAGVGSAAQSIVLALDAAGIPHHDVTLPVAPSRMHLTAPGGAILPERFWKTHRSDFGVAITVANADTMRAARAYLGPGYYNHRRHIGYWVWETDSLPGRYAAAAEGCDAIRSPSEFSAQGIRRTLGDGVRVDVVPYALALHSPVDPRPHPIELPENRTLFGSCFDARSVLARKNPAALLRAFRAAFRKDDPVTLVLKVNHGDAMPREMRELERLAEGLPVVWLRDVRLDEFQMKVLLERLDVYVSLHRSEGFGLVMAEAMAQRTPVVATGFSGNMQFMDAGSARLVSYREVSTDRSHGPYPRGTRWAEPDIEDAARSLRELHADPELRRHLGERGRQRIEQTLAPWMVAKTVRSLLGWDDTAPGGGSKFPQAVAMNESAKERPVAGSKTAGAFERPPAQRALPGE